MGVLEVDCVGVVDTLVLCAVFMVEVVEGVELVVGCVVRRVVRLVLWCVNGRGYFLRCFSLKSMEMNGLSLVGFLFWMVISVDCFILLERGYLDKMVGADVLLDVVAVKIVVVETGCGASVVLCFSGMVVWGYDGCESGDRGCGWCGGVGVVEVFCSVRMGVGVGSVGNRGGGVVSGGGNANVADGGADSGGARLRDCCRFPDGVFKELLEYLPYRLPFTLDIPL